MRAVDAPGMTRARSTSVHSRPPVALFFQAEGGIRAYKVTGVQTCALPILTRNCLTRGEARLARVTRIVLPSVAVLSTVLRTLTLLVLLATTAGAQSRDRLYASSWEIGRASCRERV